MRKLLSANFSRLWKDKAFWITLTAVFLLSLADAFAGAQSAASMAQNGFTVTTEEYFFRQVPFLGIICGVFTALFLGTENNDGTIRNKLIVGHTRLHIYLANLMVTLAAGLLFLTAGFLGELPAFLLIAPFSFGFTGFVTYLLIAAGFTAAFCALFTLIAVLLDTKASALVLTLVVWLVLLISASALDDRLREPETQSGAVLIDGQIQILDPEPNPLYLSGTARIVCECLRDFLPTGQAIQMANTDIAHPLRQLLFSLLLTVILTLWGLAAFRRKNIR